MPKLPDLLGETVKKMYEFNRGATIFLKRRWIGITTGTCCSSQKKLRNGNGKRRVRQDGRQVLNVPVGPDIFSLNQVTAPFAVIMKQ